MQNRPRLSPRIQEADRSPVLSERGFAEAALRRFADIPSLYGVPAVAWGVGSIVFSSFSYSATVVLERPRPEAVVME